MNDGWVGGRTDGKLHGEMLQKTSLDALRRQSGLQQKTSTRVEVTQLDPYSEAEKVYLYP